ncbi:MAG: tetratricopeptide repeat protein [bacterium]
MIDKIAGARRLIEAGKPKNALKLLKSRRIHPVMRGEAAFLEGEAQRNAGFFALALPAYKKASALSKNEPPLLAESLIGLAACQRALGMPDEAAVVAEQACRTASKHSLLSLELRARVEKTMAVRAKGFHAAALKKLQILIKDYHKAGDGTAEGFLWWAIGGIHRLEGRYSLSIAAFRKALKLAKKNRDKSAEGYALFGLAGVFRVAGRIPFSEKKYRAAAAIFRNSQDFFARAYAECGLANALRQKGDLDKAMAGYNRAHRLYSLLEDKADLGFVEWGKGQIFARRGKIRKALACFSEARKLFKGRAEMRGEILAGLSSAGVLYSSGHTAKAEKTYDCAVKKARRHRLHTHLEIFT